MNPILVEHVFVTRLQTGPTMQRVGQILTARRFEREGEQEMDPARPDWTVVRFRRGLANGAKAHAIAQFPQTFRIEWDRGRLSVALSLDPHRAKTPVRQQCAELLLLIAAVLENALTGKQSTEDALAEWARAEEPLVLERGAAGRAGLQHSAVPIKTWGHICLALCIFMMLSASIDPPAGMWGRLILIPAGCAAAVACYLLGRRSTMPPERLKLVHAALTGGAWSLLVATNCLLPLMFSPAGETKQLAEGTETAGTSDRTPSAAVRRPPQVKQPMEAPPINVQAPVPYLPAPAPEPAPVPAAPMPAPMPTPMPGFGRSNPPAARRRARPAAAEPAPVPTEAESAAKLKQIESGWKSGNFAPTPVLATMSGPSATADDGSVLLERGTRIVTPGDFRPPIAFRIVAQTDRTDTRVGFAAQQIIFNWEMRADELRIDGGPANGKYKPGAGRLPAGQWTGIELFVRPDEMVIYVDGAERQRVKADFSRISQPLSIEAHSGGSLKIKSIVAVRPE